MLEVRIERDVFSKFPGFRRGLVLASSIDNKGQDPELESLLSEVVEGAEGKAVDVRADVHFKEWDDAHRQFGSNPNRFPPAHKALRKRVQRPGAQLPFVNKVVAIMNLISVDSLLPIGGDDLDLAGSVLELRAATGDEFFEPLGKSGFLERPEPGEIIYVNSENVVMCRRWNWRNGNQTAIGLQTECVLVNIDCMNLPSKAEVIATRDRIAELLKRFCGAETTLGFLDPARPAFCFDG